MDNSGVAPLVVPLLDMERSVQITRLCSHVELHSSIVWQEEVNAGVILAVPVVWPDTCSVDREAYGANITVKT